MQRLFNILAGFAILLIVAVGCGVYTLSKQHIEESKQQAVETTAKSVAANLSIHMALLQGLVNTLANSPSVIAALDSNDPNKRQEAAQQLQYYIPGALKIRLLAPEIPDQPNTALPAMGFADREMAKQSFTNPPLPAIHELGADQHLAVSAKIVKGSSTIGVLLASIDLQLLNQSFQKIAIQNGYLRLLQGELELLARGDVALKDQVGQELKIENTSWRIQYQAAPALDNSLQTLLWSIIGMAALVAALVFFKGYRSFETLFINDRNLILTAIKDLVNHRLHDNYPVSLKEMRFVIETLGLLNRNLNKPAESSGDSDHPYHFAEESESFFLSSAETAVQAPTQMVEPSHSQSNLSPIGLIVSSQQVALDAIFNPGTIRGVVDKNLNKEVFYNLGRALGTELQTQAIAKIVLGYDGRVSSPAFAEALAQGIVNAGIDVEDIGLATTPHVYFAALQTVGKTAVIITGGHSPGQVNGLKLLIQGEHAHDKLLLLLKKRMVNEDYKPVKTAGNIVRTQRYNDEYLHKIVQEVALQKPLKIVLDCGNGVSSLVAPKMFKMLGCEVFELFCEINGEFPNHLPDPSKPENLSDLMAAVPHYQADLGIAFDGDGDRFGLVDSAGKIIPPVQLIQFLAKQLLQAQPGATLVLDEKSPKELIAFIRQCGGQAVLAKSGRVTVPAKLRETHALLAAEMSGRITFNDRWLSLDDALYAVARVLEYLAWETADTKVIFKDMADYSKPLALAIETQDG